VGKHALIFLIFIHICSYAQHSGQERVIETVFDKNREHKDGYEVGGNIIEIPDNIAQKCDKKKIRVTGRNVVMEEDKWVKLKDFQEVQGRYEKMYKIDEKGDTLVKKNWYNVAFYVISISAWDNQKQKWEKVYSH